MKNKIAIILGVISAAFVCVFFGLFYTQIIKGANYFRLSQENRIRLLPIEATRGAIFDRNKKLLAKDVLTFDLVVIPQELKEKQKTFTQISQLTKVPVETLEKKYQKGYTAPFAEVTLVKNLTKPTAFKLEDMNLDLRGMIVKSGPRREYVYKESVCHAVGYLGMINKREFSRLRSYGYDRQDRMGRNGLEKSLDDYLRGEDGGMQVEVDHRGRQISILGKRLPSKGKDVTLTIDVRLQEFIYQLFDGRKGAMVVCDVNTGEILALVSSPGFDPNAFIDSENVTALKRLLASKKYPLLNRAIQCQYSPGSTFKILTAVCGLEKEKISPYTIFDCKGKINIGNRKFGCWRSGGHGPQDLKYALMHSCNVYFFKLGKKIGEKDLSRFAYSFNFGKRTGIDLPDEASGLVPDRRWKRINKKETWYEGDTANFAIGQGFVLATPIQILMMTCAVANGGRLPQPFIVKSIDTVEVGGTRMHTLGLSKRNLEAIKKGLEMAVNNGGGTAIKARVAGVKASGKTGTAQVAKARSHAWFVGYAPSDKPKIALVVFLENGGYGGEEAAPIAGKVFGKLKEFKML